MNLAISKNFYDISKIPKNWQEIRLKYILSISDEKSSDFNNEEVLSLTKSGIVIKDIKNNKGQMAESYEKYILVKKNQICMNPMDLLSGWVDISSFEGITSPAYYTLILSNGFDNKFINYFLQSNYLRETFFKLGKGVASHDNFGRWILTPEELKNIVIFFPNIKNQKLISAYLDKKINQINLLIKEIKKKIELLKEQRISLINQCVTKGLDMNVEMKNDTALWIGKMPKHWKVIRLKYLFTLIGGKDPKNIQYEDGPYPIIGSGGQKIGQGKEFLYDKKTLLLGRKGTVDRPFIFDGPFWVSDVMYFVIKKTQMTTDYLFYLFTTFPFKKYIYGSTQPSMSRLDYENHFFPVPPLEEQKTNLKYLNEKDQLFQKILTRYKKKIKLLDELKLKILSEVITGGKSITEEIV